MEPEEDLASIVAAARAGSEDAWRRLVEAHQKTLIRLAWGLTGDRHLAADVAQETFVEAFVRIRQLRDDRAFGSWLWTIAVRTARRRRREPALPAPEGVDERTPEKELAGEELRRAADRALASLAPLYREALALAMDGKLSSAEAGKLLGCSAEAFRVRVHKARREVRRQLAGFLKE
jgi:RNA polymerase sigma-70 factor (ECF subfamily)